MKSTKSKRFLLVGGWTTIALGVLGIVLRVVEGRGVIAAAPGLLIVSVGIMLVSQSRGKQGE